MVPQLKDEETKKYLQRLENKINSSTFAVAMATALKSIYAEHLRLYINQETRPDFDIDEYGNEREVLLKRVFKRFNNLSEHLEKLIIISKYIDSNFVQEFCTNKEIKEVDYYQYHFENFLVRLFSILDLCAKLGNELYKLGLSEKECNWYKFTHHSEITGKACCTALLSYANYLDKLKQDRHQIIHSGGYKSQEIESIETRIFNSDLIPIADVLQDWFNVQKEEELNRLSDYINNKIENTLNYVFTFLDSMKPDFDLI